MTKVDLADDCYEEQARRILDSALSSGWSHAEVFLKVARVSRCELDALDVGVSVEQEESGVGLRVWGKHGAPGFLHADAVLERPARDLVALLPSMDTRSSGSLIPRLPRESVSGRSCAPVEERLAATAATTRHVGVEQVQDVARSLHAVFSSRIQTRGRDDLIPLQGELGTVSLRQGRVASGSVETIVLNSMGGRARWNRSVATVELLVAAARGCGSENSMLMRFQSSTDDLRRFDPESLVEEASWRAAASTGGELAREGQVPALLEPRAAAQWIRSLVPRFVGRAMSSPARAAERSAGSLADGSPGAVRDCRQGVTPRARDTLRSSGLEILDDPDASSLAWRQARTPPPPVLFDGEGRRACARVLIRGGILVGGCIDSRDPEAPEESLGPMRRDSYRDLPEPAPLNLVVTPGRASRSELLRGMGRGLFVTGLTPWSQPGSPRVLAEVRGIWMEPGCASRPIRPFVLALPGLDQLDKVRALGSDLECDPSGLPVACPSILFEDIEILGP